MNNILKKINDLPKNLANVKFILKNKMNSSFSDIPLISNINSILKKIDLDNLDKSLEKIKMELYHSKEDFYSFISKNDIQDKDIKLINNNIEIIGKDFFRFISKKNKDILREFKNKNLSISDIKNIIKQDNNINISINKTDISDFNEILNKLTLEKIALSILINYGVNNILYKSTLSELSLKKILLSFIFNIEELSNVFDLNDSVKQSFFKNKTIYISDLEIEDVEKNYNKGNIIYFNYKIESTIDFINSLFIFNLTNTSIPNSYFVGKIKETFIGLIKEKENKSSDIDEMLTIILSHITLKVDYFKSQQTGKMFEDTLNQMIIDLYIGIREIILEYRDNKINISNNLEAFFFKYMEKLDELLSFEVLYRLKVFPNERLNFYVLNGLMLLIILESNSDKVIPYWFRYNQIIDIYYKYYEKYEYPDKNDTALFMNFIIKELDGENKLKKYKPIYSDYRKSISNLLSFYINYNRSGSVFNETINEEDNDKENLTNNYLLTNKEEDTILIKFDDLAQSITTIS